VVLGNLAGVSKGGATGVLVLGFLMGADLLGAAGDGVSHAEPGEHPRPGTGLWRPVRRRVGCSARVLPAPRPAPEQETLQVAIRCRCSWRSRQASWRWRSRWWRPRKDGLLGLGDMVILRQCLGELG